MHAVLIWCNVGSCRRVSDQCDEGSNGCVPHEGIWCYGLAVGGSLV